jgi:chemotaxis protein CheD
VSGEEITVRMGELAASRGADDVLVTIGLGSCIGLALVDAGRRVAGLAHVVLPASASPAAAEPGKFADLAVPALLAEVLILGAQRARLEAVLVGGAQMFSFAATSSGARMDIGARNEAAVRDALDAERIPVRAAATRGGNGRTVRVHVGEGRVTAKTAGASAVDLLGGSARAVRA